jgi:hypothetical protein
MRSEDLKLLKAHHAECERLHALREQIEREHRSRMVQHLLTHGCYPRSVRRPVLPAYPELPLSPDALVCGGKSRRTGQPCESRAIYANGRCKWHGGLCTGPKTAAGKARSSLNIPRVAAKTLNARRPASEV